VRALLPWLAAVSVAGVTIPDAWLHNPRERTAAGLAASRSGDTAAAARAFDEALELSPTDPELTFNAGTGQLLAGAPGPALSLLERTADNAAAPTSLRADALYNLGNARVAAGDLPAAVKAYEAALRLAPDHAAAKHNLELAVRQLDEQKPPPQESPSGGGQGEGGAPQQDPQGQQQQGQPNPQGGSQQQPGENQDGQEGEPNEQPPQPGGGSQQAPRSPRLPQFAPQEDMSAEQAAALLEAVENLEREQRRANAEEQRRQRARTAVEKDW
jgi:tetratricopeptide (TPR) repeat protein